jgi:hypothetical protein
VTPKERGKRAAGKEWQALDSDGAMKWLLEEFADDILTILQDETVRKRLQALLIDGQIPHIEVALFYFAFGAPKEYRPPSVKAGGGR